MAQGRESELLERESELARGATLLERAQAGDGGTLVFAGPAGIGKTRLLAATRTQAKELGFAVAAARGSELEQELGFGIVRQLFGPALARASAAERAELLDGAAALAEEPLADEPTVPAPPGADPAFAALHGLHWLTANLASTRPLLITVDDAQWADPASLRFLAYLTGRLEGVPALAALAVRIPEPTGQSALVDTLVADPSVHVTQPQPLSVPATGVLVRERLGDNVEDVFVDGCHQASGGNPFLVAELISEVIASGIAPTGANARHVQELGPESVSRAVLARLARMPPECAELARAVAVLADPAELGDAVSLAGLDEDQSARAADALAAAGVFRRERRLGFTHPMVRTAIYEDILPNERATSHARAARALADGGAAPASVAAHLLHSPPTGERWVVDVLRRAAAEALARPAPESAVAYLSRALAEPPGPELRAGVIRELGSAELLAGSASAVEHLSQALRELDDLQVKALTALQLGRALAIGQRPEAADIMRATASEVRAADGDLAARLETEAIGVERIFGTLPEARREHLARLRGQVSPGGPAERLVLASLAFESAISGASAQEAASLATEAFGGGRLLAEEGPESPSVVMAANALHFCDRFEDAQEILERGLTAARASGSALGVGQFSSFRSGLLLRLGFVQEAEALSREVITMTGSPVLGIMRPIALAFLVEALIERGELAEAEEELERGGAASIGPDDLNASFLLCTRGWLNVVRGAPERGLACLRDGGDRLLEAGVANVVPHFWRSRAARALLALGDREEARRLAREEVALARGFGAPSALAVALRGAGVVEEGERGLLLLQESIDAVVDSPARLVRAHSLVELGSALRRTGSRAAARKPLGEGLASARSCGATALAQRAYDELTASGARPRKILRTGLDALTPSELRTAEMAADGMTNRDIAQALFVTVRTVETHLSSAYRKLDIGSRAGLPKALASEADGEP